MPVTKSDAAEHRKTAMPARSAGSPQRPAGVRWLGAITPLGGLAFLAGWLCLAWGAWKG